MTKRKGVTKAEHSQKKIFVLDTSVIIHDPHCFKRFQENDLYVPSIVLEEIDRKKNSLREARQAQRYLDTILSGKNREEISEGIPLENKPLPGRLFFATIPVFESIPSSLLPDVPDNQIIGTAFYLKEKYPAREVIVVSNDIGLRVKAIANGMKAEAYSHDQVIDDTGVLSSGIHRLPKDFWDRQEEGVTSWKKNGRTFYRLKTPMIEGSIIRLNEFVYLEKEGCEPFYARVMEKHEDTIVIATVINYSKTPIWGITPKNRGQLFALDILLDPDIHVVSLLGQAGSGKTLLALAAGLHQVFDIKQYRDILMTRMMIPIGDEIGFLPGTEEEKMTPWLGALFDNLDVLCQTTTSPGQKDRGGDDRSRITHNYLMQKINVKAPTMMRGRTFLEKFCIIDEAQNLTPKQVKTMVTRAGPGTKVVLLGNNAQIDSLYLTETTSGITYAVERLRNNNGWKYASHVILEQGERSVLAEYAERVL